MGVARKSRTGLLVPVTMRVDLTVTTGYRFAVPWHCSLTKVSSRLAAISSTGDAVLTIRNGGAADSTAIGTVTIAQSGAAQNDLDTLTPAGNAGFIPGGVCQVDVTTAATTSGLTDVTLLFELANQF